MDCLIDADRLIRRIMNTKEWVRACFGHNASSACYIPDISMIMSVASSLPESFIPVVHSTTYNKQLAQPVLDTRICDLTSATVNEKYNPALIETLRNIMDKGHVIIGAKFSPDEHRLEVAALAPDMEWFYLMDFWREYEENKAELAGEQDKDDENAA